MKKTMSVLTAAAALTGSLSCCGAASFSTLANAVTEGAQSCIDSSSSSCEADDLHHHSIHPSSHLIRERCVSHSGHKKAATNQLHNIRVQKISVRRLSFLDSGIRSFFLSLSYDKVELKKSPILSPFLSDFSRI
ncbi:hypothetical protein MOF38_16665 [Bacillus haynesii]|uniref:hypothetical protein n=1 Tax=Bacillus haynesii TaxID=1925021 RepID=UPI00227DAAC5|nr:hypothetical protein [Bacillus haynesii]MCY8008890.1 hypothetical protein [Bacillus haynesii]MCY8755628.1 hypothetical protein [Bacillus haynesii]MCY9277078.1 hypothetical protein [Bacillus haynesii]MCY9401405.1 hypothetical protein [Bacillus haynesii]MEC0710158.1 hypothetical protein [Bacillus haynesii]